MEFLNNKNRLGSLLILVFSIAYLRFALQLPDDVVPGGEAFTAKTLPIGLSVAAIVLSFVQLFVFASRSDDATVTSSVAGFQWRPALALIAAMAVYASVFNYLGFLVASSLFLFSGFVILGERRYLLSTVIAFSFVGLLWLFLTQVFGLYLDGGELFRFFKGGTA